MEATEAQDKTQQTNDPQKGKSAASIVALVLGIIALVTSFLPIINNLSFVLALVGAVFAVIGLVGVLRGKKGGRGFSIAAVIVNVLAIAIVLGTQSAYSSAINEATKGTISTEDGSSAAAASTSAESATADKYSIADEQMTGDDYTTTISGTFINLTDSQLGYVSISYNLFDADGNQIGTAYANTSNLDAGGTWKFEAVGMYGQAKVASYKLADVTGF
ncbi:FxLYD domain-containing protein [uncultured Parolsenella sp.]|uniref:FxLYD domain-containing protein n=1 Tax=uncultured Parolsenella sp. TaxID=2083008 RepID=UPI0025CB85D3|nr:FxLYD domain-containing protein [uncultured Parolsenella sp.]